MSFSGGYVPIEPGTKARFRKRALIGFALFLLLSMGIHFTAGPTLTSLAPHWRTPDVPDQSVSIVTLSRMKVVRDQPTPTPPPRIIPRTVTKLTPIRYLEMVAAAAAAAAAKIRGTIHPPARRTAMISVHNMRVRATSGAVVDAPAVTDVTPPQRSAQGETAQANAGADKSTIAAASVWGDDNPPRLLVLASLGGAPAGRHVRLEIDVGPDGQAINVRILTSSGDAAFDSAAADAARKATFAPATLNGLPVHGTITIDLPAGNAGAT